MMELSVCDNTPYQMIIRFKFKNTLSQRGKKFFFVTYIKYFQRVMDSDAVDPFAVSVAMNLTSPLMEDSCCSLMTVMKFQQLKLLIRRDNIRQ